MPVTECIAVYIRLSSEDNDVDGSIKAESNSVSAQRMLINEFIKKQDEFTNCPVVEYVDDGYSGTNFNRPGFQRMVEDAKSRTYKKYCYKGLFKIWKRLSGSGELSGKNPASPWYSNYLN